MRVLVAGATGVLGQPLLRLLSSVGCQVIALGRPGGRTAGLAGAGIAVALADPSDQAQVAKAVRDAQPDVVLQYLTAIPENLSPRRIARDFAVTNQLRAETTKYLVDAAVAAGASRFISQSVAFLYDPVATPYGELANEDAPLWGYPHRSFAANVDAIRTLEEATCAAGGLVLRFGQLYGPGTAFAADGPFTTMVRKRRLPLISGGHGVFSFTHVEDAATAVLAAIDRDVSGPLNIVDDTPVELSEWVPDVARMLGAPPPRHAPSALVRPVVGPWGVAFMTQLRGADNSRATLQLNWRPRHADWRAGFAAELAGLGAERRVIR